jgi:hypothetical protein
VPRVRRNIVMLTTYGAWLQMCMAHKGLRDAIRHRRKLVGWDRGDLSGRSQPLDMAR